MFPSGIELLYLLMRMIKLVNINVGVQSISQSGRTGISFNTRKQPDAVRMADAVAAAERRLPTSNSLGISRRDITHRAAWAEKGASGMAEGQRQGGEERPNEMKPI
ncbi:MAG: hypothetical protein U0531_02945 [Dehalococcoidia bacterium]